jgi:hypothetical protein
MQVWSCVCALFIECWLEQRCRQVQVVRDISRHLLSLSAEPRMPSLALIMSNPTRATRSTWRLSPRPFSGMCRLHTMRISLTRSSSALRSAASATEIVIKLTKKGRQPVLSFNIKNAVRCFRRKAVQPLTGSAESHGQAARRDTGRQHQGSQGRRD